MDGNYSFWFIISKWLFGDNTTVIFFGVDELCSSTSISCCVAQKNSAQIGNQSWGSLWLKMKCCSNFSSARSVTKHVPISFLTGSFQAINILKGIKTQSASQNELQEYKAIILYTCVFSFPLPLPNLCPFSKFLNCVLWQRNDHGATTTWSVAIETCLCFFSSLLTLITAFLQMVSCL